eukprot:9495240-Pyramimonas_sp.AAC.1
MRLEGRRGEGRTGERREAGSTSQIKDDGGGSQSVGPSPGLPLLQQVHADGAALDRILPDDIMLAVPVLGDRAPLGLPR